MENPTFDSEEPNVREPKTSPIFQELMKFGRLAIQGTPARKSVCPALRTLGCLQSFLYSVPRFITGFIGLEKEQKKKGCWYTKIFSVNRGRFLVKVRKLPLSHQEVRSRKPLTAFSLSTFSFRASFFHVTSSIPRR